MKKIFTLFVMLAAVLGMQAQDKYVVAGAVGLFPSVLYAVAYKAQVAVAHCLHVVAHHTPCAGAVLHVIDLEFGVLVYGEIERILGAVHHIEEIAVRHRSYLRQYVLAERR